MKTKKIAVYYGKNHLIVCEVKQGEKFDFEKLNPEIKERDCLLKLYTYDENNLPVLYEVQEELKKKTKRIFYHSQQKCFSVELETIDYKAMRKVFYKTLAFKLFKKTKNKGEKNALQK